jgi:hypothetical protein
MQADGEAGTYEATERLEGYCPEFPPGWSEYQEARRRALRQMRAGGRAEAPAAGPGADYAVSAAPG